MFYREKQNLPVKMEAFKWRLASLATRHFNTYMPCMTQLHCRAGAGNVKCSISRKATNTVFGNVNCCKK